MTSLGFFETLNDADNSPEGRGYELRLDLADIVLRHLDDKRWTQNRLANAAGIKPSYLTRVIHSNTNCTFDTAGRILHALDVRAKLVEVDERNTVKYPDPQRVYQVSSSTCVTSMVVCPTMAWLNGTHHG
jgi:AraC-like DNA-binding protein